MNIREILAQASELKASDIFLVGGLPLTYKIEKRQLRIHPETKLMPAELKNLIHELYEMLGRQLPEREEEEDDFSFALSEVGRFRANVFRQRGSLAAVIRLIRFGVPSPEECGVPEEVLKLAELKEGLVLVTGCAGSGKTTTLACVLDRINTEYEKTIITMEDPLEIIHRHKKGIVIQREISTDTDSFGAALKAALREAPDVLLIGEIRDGETMEAAMTAAETGQLLFSSLHTLSAADTVDRIVDFFPERRQPQIRAQLARVLRYVVCQKLVPDVNGRLVPAFEILTVTPAVKNLIREGKTYQFASIIKEGGRQGMISMDRFLQELWEQGRINKETLLENCSDLVQMERRLNA